MKSNWMKRLKRFIILTVGMLVWTDNWTTEEAFWRRVENVFKNLTMRTYTEILIWVVSISMKMSTMKFLLILFRKQSKDSLYYYSIWIPVKNIFTHLTLKIVSHICLEVPSIHPSIFFLLIRFMGCHSTPVFTVCGTFWKLKQTWEQNQNL